MRRALATVVAFWSPVLAITSAVHAWGLGATIGAAALAAPVVVLACGLVSTARDRRAGRGEFARLHQHQAAVAALEGRS